MRDSSGQRITPGALALAARSGLAFAWLALVWHLSGAFLGGPPWQVLLALLVTGIPLSCAFLHQFVVNRTLALQRFEKTGWLFRLLSGRLLGLLLALVAGTVGALFLLINLHVLDPWQWWVLLFFVPVFILVRGLLENWLRHEFKPFLVQARSLSWARIAAPTVLALLFACYGQALLPLSGDPGPPRAWLDAAQGRVHDLEGSAALRLVGQWLMVAQGMQEYGMAFSSSPILWRLVAALDLWLLLYLVCAVLGLLLLPGREWRRLAVPLVEAAEPPFPRPAQLAMFAGVSTFVLLFVVVPMLAWGELWVREHQSMRQGPDVVVLHLERIGERWYRPGTAARLQVARREALALSRPEVERLDAQLDLAFAAMEARVDDYLDWYYSLGGEYARIGHLLAGNLEQYMEERLRTTLGEGDVFGPVQSTLDAALAAQVQARARHAAMTSTILAESEVQPGDYPVQPTLTLELDTLLQAPVHEDLLRFESRLLASGGGAAVAGVMSAALAGKLASKMAAKAGFKLAAKSLGKVAASKAAGATMGAGAGAATGAAIGSVVPGLGTAVGALVGGVIGGLATGLAIDKALIELEEAVSREEFRAELVSELHSAREEFRLSAVWY